jgi:3-keto-5-aminohexanoate cleavage enzyme
MKIAPLVDGLATQMRKLSVLPAIEIFDPTSTVQEGLWTADSSMSVCMYSSSWVLPAQEHLLVIPLVELKNAYFQKRPGPLWGSDVINPRSWTGCWHVMGMEFGPGLKLNVRITKRPASNNAELVEIAADMCAKHNARPAEARLLLGMAV